MASQMRTVAVIVLIGAAAANTCDHDGCSDIASDEHVMIQLKMPQHAGAISALTHKSSNKGPDSTLDKSAIHKTAAAAPNSTTKATRRTNTTTCAILDPAYSQGSTNSNSFTFTKDQQITNLVPRLDDIADCIIRGFSVSISPSLPAGLSISSTAVISGTPTATSSATSYTVTGSGDGLTLTHAVSIAVTTR
eukprot:gnl/TRDRNA2_/TRDRNA2_184557_c0_seq1.p1 gnl/TRDRNA2_/TRDRNA2_184557_c0~~gnl/TRDRNA2_/TRDRNA2_184557_c0_seq1.p1  ORF type:complete len:192 (+),score=7.30 gnl/TRDRNA2_/TRDRNA2_184557_c0_seq1:95-670(+)